MKNITRREFLKGTAATAAAFAASGLLTACGSTPASSGSTDKTERTWDYETDVLILGAGGSRMCAGYEAIQAPYYAFEEGFMNLGAIGGVLINLDCQVLDVNNNPIPGLYAAGMASAGWLGPFYPGSGTALLGAIHFGRKAGKVVAAL